MRGTGVRWVVVLAVLAAAGFIVWLFWPSEEDRIRTRVAAGAEALSVPAREADLARLARLARVRAFLTDDAVVYFARSGQPPLRGRDTIVGVITRALAPHGAQVEIEGVEVRLHDQGTVADVNLRARLVSREPGAEPSLVDARSIGLTWMKVDGEWLVASVRVMEHDDSIRHPAP